MSDFDSVVIDMMEIVGDTMSYVTEESWSKYPGAFRFCKRIFYSTDKTHVVAEFEIRVDDRVSLMRVTVPIERCIVFERFKPSYTVANTASNEAQDAH